MPETIEEKYEKLRNNVTTNQSEIDRLSNANKDLKASMDVLAKKVDEVKKVFDPYNQLLVNIQTAKESITAIVIQKKAVVDADLDENAKKNISAKIKTVDDYIEKLITDEQTLINDVKEKNNKISEDKEDIVNKNIVFDNIKKYQKTIEEDLNVLKDLKTGLQKEENSKILFFYLDELRKIEEKIYNTSDIIKTKLYQAQEDLETAKALLSEEEGKLKKAQADLEAKTKEKNMKIQSRKADIINKIK
ncbi:MAG: hypothetical protein J5U17_05575 [Candidatus Methanoperedens sp.]|nr:hypothetical protein [Candidatus Methanoperedens sp.]MCE8427091.1 hypothetical protein [Candidatus Methanoperedens sp.]